MKPKVKITKKNKIKPIIFKNHCKGCGLCIESCPVKAIAFSPKLLGFYNTPSVTIDGKKCLACGACQQICPDSAIKISK